MTFRHQDLVPLCYGATEFCLWHYATADAAAEVMAPGYFTTTELRVGDQILVSCAIADRFPAHGQLVVLAAGAGGIEIGQLFLCAKRPPAADTLDAGDIIFGDPPATDADIQEETLPAAPRKARPGGR